MRRRETFYLVALGLAVACSAGKSESNAVSRDSLTRRQKDSVIGASKLPGARVVQKAIGVSDSIGAHVRRVDSIVP